MTTAASKQNLINNQKGQSLFEFVILLPIMITILGLQYKGNTLSQISINNQKYARAQTLYLAFNSPYFPERRFDGNGNVFFNDVTLLELGMSNKVINQQSGNDIPTETKYPLLRAGETEFGNPGSPEGRNKQTGTPVIRTNVAICSHPRFVIGSGNPLSLMRFDTNEYPVNVCKGHQDE